MFIHEENQYLLQWLDINHFLRRGKKKSLEIFFFPSSFDIIDIQHCNTFLGV